MTINTQYGLTAFISQPVSLLNKINLPNRQQQIIIFQVIAAALGLVALCWTAVKTRQCVLNRRIRTAQSKPKLNVEIKNVKNDANKDKLTVTQSTVEIKIDKGQTEPEKSAAAKNETVNESPKPIEDKPEIVKTEVREVAPNVESSETANREPGSPKRENSPKAQTPVSTTEQTTSVQIPEQTLVEIAIPGEKEIEVTSEMENGAITEQQNDSVKNNEDTPVTIHFTDSEIVTELSQNKAEGLGHGEEANNIVSPSSIKASQNSTTTTPLFTAETNKSETPKSSISVADLLAEPAKYSRSKYVPNSVLPESHYTPTKSPEKPANTTPKKTPPLRRLNAYFNLLITPGKKNPSTIISTDIPHQSLSEQASQFKDKLNEHHENKVCNGSTILKDPRIQSNYIVLRDAIQVLAFMKKVDESFLPPQHPSPINEKDKVRMMLYIFAQAIQDGHQSVQFQISKDLTNKQKYQQEKDFYRGFKSCNVKISKKSLPDNHRLITYDLRNFDFQAALAMCK